MRGLWPVLAILVWSMLLGVLFGGLFFAGAALFVVTTQGSPQAEIEFYGVTLFSLFFVCTMVASLLFQMLAIPLMLRGALEKDFMGAMSLGFAFDFLKNVWKELLLVICVIVLASLVAASVGMLLFCVGQYFTMGLLIMAQGHFFSQLYRLHIARGGEVLQIAD